MAVEVVGSSSTASLTPPAAAAQPSSNEMASLSPNTSSSSADDALKASTTSTTTTSPTRPQPPGSLSNAPPTTLLQRRDRRDITYKQSASARERSNTYESNPSSSTTDGRLAEFSFRTRRVSGNNWDRGFKSNVMVDDDDPSIPRANMDMNLLLASLEKEAEVVEDEAEATLLEVLERRHVTFANADIAPHSRKYHHHRTTSQNASTLLPNEDDVFTEHISSAFPRPRALTNDGPQIITRPTLGSRSISLGRSRHQSSSLQSPPPSDGYVSSSDVDEFVNAFPNLTTDHGHHAVRPPKQGSSSSNRHRRVKSAVPTGFHFRGGTSSGGGVPTTLTTPGERAKFVALSMKANKVVDNFDEPNIRSMSDSDFPDLMGIMEAQRQNNNECPSSGSQRRSGGGGTRSHKSDDEEVGRRSGGGSRYSSGPLSAENESRRGNNSNNQKWGKHRPFSGISSSPFFSNYGFMSNVDQLFRVVENVQELCKIPENEEADDVVAAKSDVLDEENAKFLSRLASYPVVPPVSVDATDNAAADEQTPLVEPSSGPQQVKSKPSPRGGLTSFASYTQAKTPGSRFYTFCVWWNELCKQLKMLAVAFDGAYVKERLWNSLQNDVSMFIIPLLSISAFFYYQLNNPILPIFSTDASISWWILFVIRHYVTLLMAFVAEYLLVDVSAMRCLLSVQLIGPLATLYTINAKGWPFILTSWALLNYLLIYKGRGNDPSSMFFDHWLYFTDIEMFTAENPSGGVVESEKYEEILLAMLIVGVSTSLKRTVLALYLGKRVYNHYRPKMEKIMESMILLTEVADLGNAIVDFDLHEVDHPAHERNDSRINTSMLQDNIKASTMIDIVNRQGSKTSFPDLDAENEENEREKITSDSPLTVSSTPWNRLRTGSNSSDDTDTMEKVPDQEPRDHTSDIVQKDDENDHTGEYLFTEDEPPIAAVLDPLRGVLRDDSSTARIKSLLDEWEEPVNKADKMADPTIHEILQFRKALTFLDDTYPFGSSFGPAFSRDSCIKSAKSLYKRLLELSPGSSTLNFDVIGGLAYNIDGTFDDKKAKSLVKLFRPDKYDEVSLLNFAQSCDGVYKRIRYLRASVGNSTLIDSVLENIFNGAFSFVLALIIMSVLDLNPWTLLISLSTVLVSFAFALGPSAAKLIEGMIMIAVRRPFDLGDRISIVDYNVAPDNSDDPGYRDTWIVEDCNLFTTTLRLCRTNELSTVNNGAISNTRIVNHARSLKALVNIQLPMTIKATHEQIQIVKSALVQYIRDKPRVWSSLIDFRITKVDSANELVVYSARVQHVKSWQNQQLVLHARGELEYFCNEILFKLGIDFLPSYVVGNQCPMQSNLMVPDSLYSRRHPKTDQSSSNQFLVRKQSSE